MPDVGAVRFGRCGPKRPKKNQKISRFFREVTPGSPSPRKPHVNTGSRSNTAPFSQMPVWGVFGVRGHVQSEHGTGVGGGSTPGTRRQSSRTCTGTFRFSHGSMYANKYTKFVWACDVCKKSQKPNESFPSCGPGDCMLSCITCDAKLCEKCYKEELHARTRLCSQYDM